ncbi:uncharacterized protein LOC26528379 [Drosophila mojavensis]|uniref:Uncharacterized protein n=1 Tax=Drosophila mojavensis TaxID=7230 RepID=A0A0Q9XEF5_DROMO|nr:uncharacterized protein LOC26528379 [Drosophila mojavensis]KRG03396.1 uncharacterized protein Dmoj_GI26738 [Drosophila mojavensis]
MEKDLDFLIKALSLPNSPLWSEYSDAQLRDMRESFISLKDVLQQNQFDVLHETPSHMVRFKAGGNTVADQVTTDQVPDEYQFPKNFQSSLTSLSSSSLSADYGTTNNDDDDDKQDKARQGDDETSTTDNFLALVPYEKDVPSTELVRYEPWLETVEDDSDTETLCASSSSSSDSISCSGARSMSTSSGGAISISIPMQMEYVWHNSDYNADSTDSDLTIIADGFNYVLSR